MGISTRHGEKRVWDWFGTFADAGFAFKTELNQIMKRVSGFIACFVWSISRQVWHLDWLCSFVLTSVMFLLLSYEVILMLFLWGCLYKLDGTLGRIIFGLEVKIEYIGEFILWVAGKCIVMILGLFWGYFECRVYVEFIRRMAFFYYVSSIL